MARADRAAREEAADTLCETIREYIVDHDCEVVVHVNEIPAGVWDDQSGGVFGEKAKRQIVQGGHVIEYWRVGA